MFAGELPSKAQIKAMEKRTAEGVQFTVIACLVLYLSPFAVDYAQSFF